jgi:cytochrome b561
MTHTNSYSRSQKLLHWGLFALVSGLYLLTYVPALFPRESAERAWVWWLHISFGLLLAALVIARIGLRVARPAPAPVAGTSGWASNLASAMHVLLYLLLVALPISGVVLTWARGDALSFFGAFAIPAPFAPDRAFAREVREVHEFFANAIVLLAVGHATAALWHHFVLRDDVLRRMLPSSEPLG